MLNSHMWLGTTILGSTDKEHFHHLRQFGWAALGWKLEIQCEFRDKRNQAIVKVSEA